MAGEVYELDDLIQFLKFIKKMDVAFFCKSKLDNTP